MVVIQTKEMNQYVQKNNLRGKMIKLYGLIWGHFSLALLRELEGNAEYIINSPTYNCIWMYNKVKMCTSGIDHTSIGYHSTVMATRKILCLRQGIDKPTEEYYRIFEAAISMADMKKYNTTTHMELNKA